MNGAVHAVKLDGKCHKAHKDFIRYHGMSPVATSAELHHVYRTWGSSRRCTSQRSAGGSAIHNPDCIHLWDITSFLFDVHEVAKGLNTEATFQLKRAAFYS